jgi:regulation of enolase protein 1 (concanavalin A-like superfamily)
LAIGQDWTKAGVKALTLWFYGNTANDANATEQMYVKLNGVKKNYDDMNDIRQASWHEWNIDLSAFGISLSNVTSIAIGLGNETNTTTPGGSGVVYFDDIWLYPPRCLSSLAKPEFSINGDCVVDALDVQVMAGDWLDQEVAELAWNGTFSDSDIGVITVPGSFTAGGGNVYTIQGEGADIWSTSDAFHYAYRQISGDFQMTVRVTSIAATHEFAKAGIMVRQSLDPNAANVFIAATPAASSWSNAGSTFQWRTALNSASSSSRTLTGPSIPMCIRLVRNGNSFTGHIFVNGRWQQQGTAATVTMTDPVYIGLAATSHAAGTLTTATFDRTCTFSGSDLRQDGLVNFKDYAVLATAWLEEVLWP